MHRPTLSIYIVEDNPALGELESEILNAEPGYTASWELLRAGSFERIRAQSPDLVIIELPPAETPAAAPYVALLDQLAADPQTAAIPVMVITTSEATAARLAARPNVRTYVTKPYDVVTLLNTVVTALGPRELA